MVSLRMALSFQHKMERLLFKHGKDRVDQLCNWFSRGGDLNIKGDQNQNAKAYQHKSTINKLFLCAGSIPFGKQVNSKDCQEEYDDNDCGHYLPSCLVSFT
jgi:hypothetical protein